ncbi:penicillin-binding protein [Cellulomonas sp. DKR-3]|uniref:Beta-lactamase n=1 Tax=Cellulomonas fulva TaxID=2835530 RepID=A0ABS5TWQ9_9CELL|nr:penicillin-binding transpeptidase domain-containing protein [Cellulomonas fulva]MBT0993580.1 penicillin-binding protein [Cellulomonas fulva]
MAALRPVRWSLGGPAGRPSGGRRVVVGGAVTLGVVLGALTGCTSEPPGPQDAAEALAAGLAAGDLSEVDLVAGTTPAQAQDGLASAFEALAAVTPAVTLRDARVDAADDASATATLDFAWDLDGPGGAEPWTYATTAHLQRDDEDVWRTAWTPAILAPDLTADEALVVTREAAPRAEVLGADDEVIVEARPVHRIGIDKTRVTAADQDAAARGLAAALELDADAYAERVASAGDKAFVEAIVVRDTDDEYDVDRLSRLPGVLAVADELPLAPTRDFARPVLGTVGTATAEIIEKSGGAVAAGDLAGLSGLQRQYDAVLRGTPGLTVAARSDDGDRELMTIDPVAGQDLRTTLDVDLQSAAEDVLADVAPASALVAVRPSTGEVLAAASGPGGEGLSTATLGQYAPGSTFKVVSTLALLRSGLGPASTVSCPPSVVVDGRQFDNFPDYPADALGEVPLRTAFANSCNTAFIGQRAAAPQDALVDAAGSLGLMPAESLGFSSFLGTVPSDSDGTDHAATMIGQGRVLASPLGMATVAASVAAGRTVTPVLVVDPPADEDGDTATDGSAGSTETSPDEDGSDDASTGTDEPRPLVPLAADEAAQLRDLMRAVVTDGGASFLQDVPGADVLAKTGTAQFGPQEDLRNHVWMIAVQGDLAVAVFVDEGEYGSTTAGPLLTRFLEDPAVARG